MPKKILIITPFYFPNVGGAESFCRDLANEIAKEHLVTVCTIKWRGQKTFKGTGIAQLIDIFPKLLRIGFKGFLSQKADYAIGIGLNAAFIGAILGAMFRVRVGGVILALYGFSHKNPIFKAVCRFALSRMEKIFVEGEGGKDDVMALGIPESKIIIFHHWCDQSIFKPVPHKNTRMRVLFVGRAIPEKGIHIIKEAEQKLEGRGIDFEYIENVPHKDLPAFYQRADVVVVPSLYAEGFARVVIESASCGCALVVSNRGSLPEMVRNFGIVIEPTPDEFALELEMLSTNRTMLELYQSVARTYAELNFSNKNAGVFLHP